MKYSQAEHLIREALWCVQHLRSINAEQDADMPGLNLAKASKLLMPWTFDDEQTLLHPLSVMVERMDNGGRISGQEFYNIMFVIWRWAGIVDLQLQVSTHFEEQFPEPDIKWLLGWEPEDA